MRRGTTATHTITTGIDLSQARVFVTYMQGANIVLERTSDDATVTVTSEAITIALSQEDTLTFAAGAPVQLQVRYIFENGVAGASDFMTFTVNDVLKKGQIAFTDPTIEISGESSVSVGSNLALTATTDPSGLGVTWESSDESIATVDAGLVTGVAPGSVVITGALAAYPGISATKAISVTE